jgi:hypothetical protein
MLLIPAWRRQDRKPREKLLNDAGVEAFRLIADLQNKVMRQPDARARDLLLGSEDQAGPE